MVIIMFGPPASGKGTVSGLLSKNHNINIVSTGELIRENIKQNTQIGLQCKTLVSKGELIPDELVNDMILNIKDKLLNSNVILDGYPRTLNQAMFLNDIVNVDYVFDLEVDDSVLIERVGYRKICANCKSIFGKETDIKFCCSKCGGELVVREDDNIETIKNRINLYNKQTKPILNYYKNKKVLHKVNGNQKAQKVCDDITKMLKGENYDL